jgi:dTDP-D-glucose 4,6-dehydratase
MSHPYWLCDNQLIEKDLGWQPQIAIGPGLAQTVRWYRERRWL